MRERTSESKQDLRTELIGMLGQLWRRRWLILGTAWAICLVGWTATMLWPNRYESRARIFVDAETLLSPLLKGMSVVSNVNKQASVVQRTLLAPQNLEIVLERHRPDLRKEDRQAWERALRALEAATTVDPEGGRESRLFLVTHRDADRHRAKQVVETLLDIFIARSTEASRTDLAQAKDFIGVQLAHYEGLLRDAEARLAEFKRRHVGLLPQSGNFAQSVEAARSRLVEIRAQLEEAKSRRRALSDELARTPQYLSVDGAAPQVIITGSGKSSEPTRAVEIEAKLAELLLRYTEKHPDVVATRRLLEQVREQPAHGPVASPASVSSTSSRRQVSNIVYEQIRLKLVDLEGEVQMLERRHADQSTEVERLGQLAATAPAIEAEFTALNRDYAVLKSNYEQLLERRESAKLSEDMQTRVEKVQFSVVEAPTLPTNPVVPNRPLLLALFPIAGLGTGALIALLLYQLRRPLVTLQQLRDSFPVPVLGEISRIEAARSAPARRLATIGFVCAAAGLVVSCAVLMLWTRFATVTFSAGSAL